MTMEVPHLRQRILARRFWTLSSAIEYLAEHVGQEIFTRWLSVPSVSRVRSEGRYFPYAVTHSAGASGAVDASRASHFLFDVSRGEVVSYWLTARNPPRFARAP